MHALLRRTLFQLATTLFVTAASVFFVIIAMESLGDPIAVLLPADAPPAQAASVRHDLGLDRPFPLRAADRVRQVIRGDFGRSYATHDPAGMLVMRRLPATLQLMLAAAAVGLPGGVVIGLLLHACERARAGRWPLRIALLLRSVPSFAIGIVAVRIVAVDLGWVPPSGNGTVRQLILPASVLALDVALTLAIFLRDRLHDLANQPFATAALGRGLSWAQVDRRHLLRAALPAFASYATLRISALAGGALVVEQIFNYQGLGQLALLGLRSRDLPVVLACTTTVILAMGIIRLALELVQPVLDPLQRGPAA